MIKDQATLIKFFIKFYNVTFGYDVATKPVSTLLYTSKL